MPNTLTAGADTPATTSGDDVINALTIDAAGAAATTFSAFDNIDGKDGNDTLNIYTNNTGTAGTSQNAAFPTSATVKNVETVNIFNGGTQAAALGDASKFEGVTQLWQHGVGTSVTNLAGTTTAGFKGVDATAAANLGVTATATATTATIALDGVKGAAATTGAETINRADIDVAGAALTSVTVSGTLAAKTTTAVAGQAEVQSIALGTLVDTVPYTLTAGGVTLTTGATGVGNDAAAIVAAIQGALGYAAAPFTVALDGANIALTWNDPSNVTGLATLAAAGYTTATATETTPGIAPSTTTVAPTLALNVSVAKDAEAATVDSAVATVLTIENAAGSTKNLSSVDASASTGAITYQGADAQVATIKTGAGADTVSLNTTTAAAAVGVTAVAALVSTGAGVDRITVNTDGNGTTMVDAGAGNDVVNVTARSTGVLTVNLGEGDDTFTSAVAINGTDVIDAGAGTDTLALSLVGASNIGAFSNFDAFDVAAMAKTLDVDILASKNTVTEFIGSATSGTAALTNIGAGVNFRATGDMGTGAILTLTQKAAGALTITLDADETGTADTTIDFAGAKIAATNATSLNAVFDTSYLADITGETKLDDNVSTLDLTGVASTLSIVSGGANASNVLVYDDVASVGGVVDALTSVTVSGDRALNLDFITSTKLALVDASAQTGGLTFSLADLADKGGVVLGSGKDVITVTNASTTGAVETITNFEKTAAVSVSDVLGDAAAKAAAIADADVLVLAGATVADANPVVTEGTIAKGVLTFTGAGPADLGAAIAIADAAANVLGEALVFEYIGNSYAFVQGNATDTVVQLVGITGVTNFAESTATVDNFFIV